MSDLDLTKEPPENPTMEERLALAHMVFSRMSYAELIDILVDDAEEDYRKEWEHFRCDWGMLQAEV